MNQQQTATYLQALAASLTIKVIIPGLMLLALVGLFLWVIFQAQKRQDFDASEFLRGEDNKLSMSRLFAFVACCWSTWHLSALTFDQGVSEEKFMVYLATWSGSLVALQAINAFRPGSKPPPMKDDTPQ